MRHTHHRGGRGLTLVEILISLAILGVALAVALPLLAEARESLRLRSTAEILATDLRLAQSETIKRQLGVSLNLRIDDDGWCYGMSTNGACDCREAQSCTIDQVERVVRSQDFPGIGLQPGIVANRFAFDPRRGTVRAGNVTLISPTGKQLRVVASGVGRIRICSPSGPGYLNGYQRC